MKSNIKKTDITGWNLYTAICSQLSYEVELGDKSILQINLNSWLKAMFRKKEDERSSSQELPSSPQLFGSGLTIQSPT